MELRQAEFRAFYNRCVSTYHYTAISAVQQLRQIYLSADSAKSPKIQLKNLTCRNHQILQNQIGYRRGLPVLVVKSGKLYSS